MHNSFNHDYTVYCFFMAGQNMANEVGVVSMLPFELIRKLMSYHFAIIVLTLSASVQAGVGDLTVTPTRAIFGDRTRSLQISLVNRGDKAALYRIEFVQMRMDEHGNFTEIAVPKEGEKFADKLVRYSPRQIMLEPNVGQTVRLLLRKPPGLEIGEYRSHLLMYAVPDMGQSISEAAQSTPDEGLSIDLKPIFRVSIPVIVRHGNLNADMRFSKLEHSIYETDGKQQNFITIQAERSGQRSVYGDISVVYKPDNSSEEYIVGKVTDFVIYTPNKTRTITIAVYPPEGLSIDKGELTVNFKATRLKDKPELTRKSIHIGD